MNSIRQAVQIAATEAATVVYFAETPTDTNKLLAEALSTSTAMGLNETKAKRLRGAEELTLDNGGRILFRAINGCAHRGVRADCIFLPNWELILDSDFMMAVLPIMINQPRIRIGVDIQGAP